MRFNRCVPALALLVFLPARADEGAAKAPPPGDEKPASHSCCAGEKAAGEKAAGEVMCPKGNAKTARKKAAAKAKDKAAPAAQASARPPVAPGSNMAPGTANMVVTRDPETGEIRNATPEERAKLFAGRAPQAASATPRVVVLPDGTSMVELGEDSMSYAVVSKNPDGSVTQSCVHGKEAATRVLVEPKPAPAPRAEER